MEIFAVCLLVVAIASAFNHTLIVDAGKSNRDSSAYDIYPDHVPKRDSIRKDMETKQPVVSGRLENLGSVSAFAKNPNGKWKEKNDFELQGRQTVSYEEFRRTLQCAPSEPGLHHHGTLALMKKLHPVTRSTIETACALVENDRKCIGNPWGQVEWDCLLNFANDLKQGKQLANDRKDHKTNVRLVRVHKGRLFYDWPWKIIHKPDPLYQFSGLRLLGAVLEIIHDMPDSVFLFVSFDFPFLPSFFPFPALSNGPKIDSSDIPYPWVGSLNDEYRHYLQHFSSRKSQQNPLENFHDTRGGNNDYPMAVNPSNDTMWSARRSKAIHIGSLWFTKISMSRQVVLDLADKRPDLIEAKWTGMIGNSLYHPNQKMRNGSFGENAMKIAYDDSKLLTTISPTEIMQKYKYLVVLAGISAGERLTTYLAHSGAVILLQETDIVYHYSARLKPWVHYVPLSHSAADLIEKLEWLKANDKLARQIARNGYAFGKSYLRLEDFYCYAAAAMHAFAKVATSEALQPFEPKRIFDEIK